MTASPTPLPGAKPCIGTNASAAKLDTTETRWRFARQARARSRRLRRKAALRLRNPTQAIGHAWEGELNGPDSGPLGERCPQVRQRAVAVVLGRPVTRGRARARAATPAACGPRRVREPRRPPCRHALAAWPSSWSPSSSRASPPPPGAATVSTCRLRSGRSGHPAKRKVLQTRVDYPVAPLARDVPAPMLAVTMGRDWC